MPCSWVSGARRFGLSKPVCWHRCPSSVEIPERNEPPNEPRNEPSGGLRCRRTATPGRPADGRRRQAVRRAVSEVQATGGARAARADRRDRQEALARPSILARGAGKTGEATGECGGSPVEDEPAGEGLAALEAHPRPEGTELPDPSPGSAGGRR